MRIEKLYDQDFIYKIYKNQIDNVWDLENDIPWGLGINHQKFFAPLDDNALFLPGANLEERRVISQFLGLVIACAIYELEESLLRLKKPGWKDIYNLFPLHKEFELWGEQFFIEEEKHSKAFKRYVEIFAHDLDIDYESLLQILPVVEASKSEKVLEYMTKSGGYGYWWIAAIVEQEFLHMYRLMEKQEGIMDPLYYDIHKKHYEEERRHASFPYFVLDLLYQRDHRLFAKAHQKLDLSLSQSLLASWTLASLLKVTSVKKLKNKHEFFFVLNQCIEKYKKESWSQVIWNLFTSAPYISSLVNPQSHKAVIKMAEEKGALLPIFFELEEQILRPY